MGICRQSKCSAKGRIRVLTFMFSTLGLIILTFSWLMFGGWLFRDFEKEHEKIWFNETKWKLHGRLINTAQKLLINLTELAETVNVNKTQYFHNDTITEERRILITTTLREMVQFAFTSDINKTWSGDVALDLGIPEEMKFNYTGDRLEWTFANSMLFSATIITTIGYGHITPKTPGGRIVTILYALIGIPITLVTLAKIGTVMGLCFRLGYYQFMKGIWTVILKFTNFRRPPKRKKTKEQKMEQNEQNKPKEPNALTEPGYESANADDTSDKTITKSSESYKKRKSSIKIEKHASVQIGEDIEANKDVTVNKENKAGLFSLCFACCGNKDDQDANIKEVELEQQAYKQSYTQAIASHQVNHSDSKRVNKSQDSAKNDLLEEHPIKHPSKVLELKESKPRDRKGRKKTDKKKALKIIARYQKLQRKVARERARQRIRVPITVSILLIVGYVMLGALIFSKSDNDDWTFLVSCYFCFTTISTIGFGDFVFGQGNVSQEELVGTCVYIMIGLSLNSMCIDLMAFEIMEKARQIASNFGFHDDDSDDEDNEEEKLEMKKMITVLRLMKSSMA